MFFMAEYINMVTVSAVAVNLFLGGWHGPLIPPEYGWIWFVIKLAFLLFCYLWLRWTLPRFRYDQLMSFGWKVLLPLATVNLLLTAAGMLYFVSSDALLFYAFAGAAVLGALLVVSQKNPVYSVLALIASFFGLSGLYVLLEAPFVAVVQIIIYAGAIMVLFLFTVMLLNVPREDAAEWDRVASALSARWRSASARALALLMALAAGLGAVENARPLGGVADERAAASSVSDLGVKLFSGAGDGFAGYMFAFEVTSILIIIAMVGAVVIARKRED